MSRSITSAPFFGQQKVSQQPSTSSQGDESPQLSLLGVEPRKKPSAPVDMAYLRSLPSLRRAVAYSLSLADMDPKEAYSPLGMDKATWSRIINGTQEVPASLLKPLRTLTGNDAPIRWLAMDCGYEIRPLRTELEQQLEAINAEKAEVERENAILRRLLTEGRR